MSNKNQEQRIREALSPEWQTTGSIIKESHVHPYTALEVLQKLQVEGFVEMLPYLTKIKKWRLKVE